MNWKLIRFRYVENLHEFKWFHRCLICKLRKIDQYESQWKKTHRYFNRVFSSAKLVLWVRQYLFEMECVSVLHRNDQKKTASEKLSFGELCVSVSTYIPYIHSHEIIVRRCSIAIASIISIAYVFGETHTYKEKELRINSSDGFYLSCVVISIRTHK